LLHVFLGKSFGRLLPQDADESYLCDVVDPGEPGEEDPDDAKNPGRRWNDLPCHTDHAFGINPPKTVAFLCFRSAGRGGAVRLVSAATLVDRLRATDPAQIEALARPVPFNPARQLDPADPYLARVPILAQADGGIQFRYLNYQIALDGLDPRQSRAIAALESILSSGEVACRLFLQPGDILLINNMRVLHGREAYENTAERRAPRHHLRLWLT
jgi:alpha-ketoglutarate-dependent taurine dioxygenase